MVRKTPRYLSLLPNKSVVDELILKHLQSIACLRTVVLRSPMTLSTTSNGDFPHKVVGRLSCLPNLLRPQSRSRLAMRLSAFS